MHAYEKNVENGLVVHGFNYGDWLALDGEILKTVFTAEQTPYFLRARFIWNVCGWLRKRQRHSAINRKGNTATNTKNLGCDPL